MGSNNASPKSQQKDVPESNQSHNATCLPIGAGAIGGWAAVANAQHQLVLQKHAEMHVARGHQESTLSNG